jgi:hypothetical protein
MNGHANCILAVCCPPDSDGQRKALAEEMASSLSTASGETYEDIARWILDNFDLAPKGSLQTFKDEIARLAREGHVKVEGGEGL